MADAVSLLNPSVVVLGGQVARGRGAAPGLRVSRELIYQRSLPLATRSLQIVLSTLGDRAGILGGAYLAIEHRLAPDALDRELERRIEAGAPLAAWAA